MPSRQNTSASESPKTPAKRKTEPKSEEGTYYYDDAHGYRTYDPKSELTVYTIGHSTRDLADLVKLLKENGIELLVDVRSFPGSRKFPHFNKENLTDTLPAEGIEYIHLRELGGRRRVAKDSKHTVWRHPAFRGYADYMETDAFREGIEELVDLAEDKKTAIMCSEAVWWRCHRSMISDYLKAAGVKVLHIMDEGKTVEHPFTAAATVEDGHLFYGPAKETEGE